MGPCGVLLQLHLGLLKGRNVLRRSRGGSGSERQQAWELAAAGGGGGGRLCAVATCMRLSSSLSFMVAAAGLPWGLAAHKTPRWRAAQGLRDGGRLTMANEAVTAASQFTCKCSKRGSSEPWPRRQFGRAGPKSHSSALHDNPSPDHASCSAPGNPQAPAGVVVGPLTPPASLARRRRSRAAHRLSSAVCVSSPPNRRRPGPHHLLWLSSHDPTGPRAPRSAGSQPSGSHRSPAPCTAAWPAWPRRRGGRRRRPAPGKPLWSSQTRRRSACVHYCPSATRCVVCACGRRSGCSLAAAAWARG